MQTPAITKEAEAITAGAQRIFGLISAEMAAVEDEFRRQAASNIEVIDYLGQYLRSSGGKRLRPALLVLSNYAVGGNADEGVIRLATVMEMLHTATLVHDDIIDNADLRRGRASINSRFGDQTAVLMGDWLYMSAFETSLKQRSLQILDILTRLTRKMTEGELMQLTLIGNADISEDQYFDILRRKTAYLFSACCEIGALLAGGKDEEQAALRDYGMNLGIAFQLADDLLDFTAEEKMLGKASGADLLEGKVTLPLIIAARSDESVRSSIRGIIKARSHSNGSKAELLESIRSNGSLEETRSIAASYAELARKNLEVLPKTAYISALNEIPAFAVGRSV